MPTIKTGNVEWDQNLNTLGAALFPDPSKAASAYYYGTKSRESLLESAKTQGQMSALNTQVGMTFGRAPNPTYRPGPFDTSIMNDPYAVPAAPGPTAPPAAPGQPVPPQSALPTLAQAVTTTPPAALADAVVAGVENNASSGPGPEATGSNGTVPQNGPGTFRPGSVTSAGGGGVIMAGPAAADGTPAPSSFNFGQAIALGVAAGQTPEQSYAVALGTLGNMVKNGQIALPLAEQMAAFYGRPQMRVQTQADQGALARTQLTEGGATARNAATIAAENARNTERIAGENLRTGMPTTFIPDPDPVKAAQGAGRYVPLAQQQVLGGMAGTNPAAVTELVKPQIVQPGGPTTPTYSETTGQAQAGRSRLADAVTGQPAANAAYKIGQYYHPDRPTIILDRTLAQAQAEGLYAATSEDVARAAAGGAVLNAPTPDAAAAAAANKNLAFPPPTRAAPRTAVEDADEQNAQQILIDRTLDQMFPADPTRTGRGFSPTDALSGAASPELGPVLRDLSNQYLAAGPTKGDRIASTQAAVNQLVTQGYVIPGQTRSRPVSRSFQDNKTGVITQTPHFRVELHDPKTLQPYPAGKAPTRIPMQTLGGAVTTPAPGAPAATPAPAATVSPSTAPAGAIGTAPAGTPDGPRTIGGKPVIVRGGHIFPG